MAGLTLDSGALIAAERNDREFWSFWKEAVRRQVDIVVPAGVLAQVWRGSNVVVARVLKGCEVETLDLPAAKSVGSLLAQSRQSDVIDASVIVGAARRGHVVLTSDVDDLQALTEAMGANIRIVGI